MTTTLKIALAQLDFLVGDIEGNADKIINAIEFARTKHSDLIIFPELSLTGYPPEDLLFRPSLYLRVNNALKKICQHVHHIDVVLGYPEKTVGACFNAAAFIREGEIINRYYKQQLPNYSVFDEVRYFKTGNTPCVVPIKNIPTAITICEDLWYDDAMQQAVAAGAKLVISLNASPFSKNKAELREKTISRRAKEGNMPIVYVNCTGSQDELVFDGGSMVIDAKGEICQQANFFKEEIYIAEIQVEDKKLLVPKHSFSPPFSEEERIYKALVLGVRDYIQKNKFPSAVIGLSGGIDSALTLAIAADAIGTENVSVVLMPSRYTAKISIEDALQQANTMGVKHHTISIEPIFEAFLASLKPVFKNATPDVTEENLQARCRGTLLMSISNKTKAIVLATGNKSEMSVGYSTLYGDMVGGFCVLKDVPKMLVYRLAHYRNSLSFIIPERVLTRAPSAELAPNQKDEDSLPPYSVLDAILERYIELDESVNDIVKAGFDEQTVRKVARMVTHNEYKRRQAAPGVRITERAFGKDRRYPITSGFLRFEEN